MIGIDAEANSSPWITKKSSGRKSSVSSKEIIGDGFWNKILFVHAG